MNIFNYVSEFTLSNTKNTPLTRLTTSEKHSSEMTGSEGPSHSSCANCSQNLAQVNALLKKQIALEYENSVLKQKISKLMEQNQYLVQEKVKTYLEYEQLLPKNQSHFNKEDLESELFEAKFVIQLLQLSKIQTKASTLNAFNLKQKYEEKLFENLRSQEKIIMRDRIISQRCLFPLYHYDQRILMLRKAVQYWYKRAESKSLQLKAFCKDMRNQFQIKYQDFKSTCEAEFKIYRSIILQLQEQKISSQKRCNEEKNEVKIKEKGGKNLERKVKKVKKEPNKVSQSERK